MSPITSTAAPDLKRQYPHVDDVTDWRAQQTIRLLWDRVFDLEARLQAAESTTGDLVESVNTQEDTLARLELQLASLPPPSAGVTDIHTFTATLTVPDQIVYQEVPFDMTLESWRLVGNADPDDTADTINATVNVWAAPFAAFPPTAADSICGTDLPELDDVQSAENSALVEWDTDLKEGDWIAFAVVLLEPEGLVATISLVGRRKE